MHVLKKHKPINAICETGSYTNSLLQLFDAQLTRTASAFYHLLTITMNPPKRQYNTMKLFPEINNISSSESLKYKNTIAMQVSTTVFVVSNVKMPEGKLHCNFHGEQDFLQRLHLLHQHGLLNIGNYIQATVVVGILKHLVKSQVKINEEEKREQE